MLDRGCLFLSLTDLHREARGKPEVDEVPESGKVSAGASHQVNDGSDLLHQRQRMLFTHPQGAFEPESGSKHKTFLQLYMPAISY